MKTFLLTSLYLISIIVANLTVTIFGPSVAILNAFIFIGLDLTTRDQLHEAWLGRYLLPKMVLLISAGSFLSYIINKDAGSIAIASLISFALAACADTVVYHLLRKKTWYTRSNGSNIAGAAFDSILFPTLAFGTFLPEIILGQFLAKILGGFFWSWILGKNKVPSHSLQVNSEEI